LEAISRDASSITEICSAIQNSRPFALQADRSIAASFEYARFRGEKHIAPFDFFPKALGEDSTFALVSPHFTARTSQLRRKGGISESLRATFPTASLGQIARGDTRWIKGKDPAESFRIAYHD